MSPERESGGAPVIRGDVPGSFARSVLASRHPAIIRQVREALPFGPAQRRALDGLLREITSGMIEPLPPGAADQARWESWGRGAFGRSWFDVPFLWAESYFYRRVLAATGYFAPGPWQGADPFAPVKQAELDSSGVQDELAAVDQLAPQHAAERGTALLGAALWGNRADLGFRLSSGAPQAAARSDLVADDSALLWDLLPPGPGRAAAVVHLVADNAGRELIPDLLLIDHLLAAGHAGQVVLQVKPYPYFVSDATMADVVGGLRRLRQASGQAAEAGERLWRRMTDGRLEVRSAGLFCAPRPYREMPGALREVFAGAALTIMKGDLNYRRLVGDQLWPATARFSDLVSYFPGPVAVLRILKSDVVAGLSPAMVRELDSSGQAWRTSGTRAMIQVRP